MSTAVPAQANWIKIEESISKFWKEHKLPEKAFELSSIQPQFTILEQPYRADQKPSAQALISWTIKDALSRYQSLCGWNVKRIFGWNTISPHLMLAAEKKVKTVLNQIGESPQPKRLVEIARRTAFDYLFEWERLFERCGFWLPWQEAAVLHTREFVNTAWQTVKILWERNLIIRKPLVVPYCPNCLTPLSWQEADIYCADIPAYQALIRFPLMEDSSTSLLVCCNEPWKLSATIAVAVNPEADYVLIECNENEGGKEQFILSQAAYQSFSASLNTFAFNSCTILHTFKGKKLKDIRYRPLFVFFTTDQAEHYVVLDKEVDEKQGSGILPITALHDVRGYELSVENHLPLISPILKDGTFVQEAKPWHNKFFKDVESSLIDELSARGLLVWQETMPQKSPYCPYCQTLLLPYLEEVCTLDLSSNKAAIQQAIEQTSWYPETAENLIKEILEHSSSWVLSRRNWISIPLPIWLNDDNQPTVISSLEELAQLAQTDVNEIPWLLPDLDELTFAHPQTGRLLQRVPDTLDPTFIAALLLSVHWQAQSSTPPALFPTSQITYTVDLICEPLEAMQPWLYAAHFLHSLLYKQPLSRHIVSLAFPHNQSAVVDEPNNQLLTAWFALLNEYNADFLRWAIFKQAAALQNADFSQEAWHNLTQEEWINLAKPFFDDLWKAYTFFITFSREQNWRPQAANNDSSANNPGWNLLERWMFSSLQATLRRVHEALQGYHFDQAVSSIEQWVKKLTHVFLPLMHQFFWNAPETQAAHQAFQYLHDLLATLCRTIAPFAPYAAEEIYQNVVRFYDPDTPISVHHSSFPTLEASLEDEELNKELDLILYYADLGTQALEKGKAASQKYYKEVVYVLEKKEDLLLLEKYQFLLRALLKVKRVSARLKQHDFAFEESEVHLLIPCEKEIQIILMAD